MAKHSVAVLVGSIRAGSLNRKVARALCGSNASALDCRVVEIADLPLYNSDLDENPPPPWERFREEVDTADGVLFVTPEYNRSVPGVLKNAIDIGSRPYGKSVWAKKPAGIVTASPGALGGFGCNHHLRQCAMYLDMPMLQQPEAYLGKVSDQSFSADGAVADEGLSKLLGSFAAAFSGWIELIAAGRAALAPDPAGSGA